MKIPGGNTGDPYGPWFDHNFVVFDTETTGLTETDRIIEIGLARFERGELVASWGTLIQPGIEVPAEATAIHGISTADVASAPGFIEAIGPAGKLCRDAWPCAYNASFDKKMLRRELARLRLTELSLPLFSDQYTWIDPLAWVRKVRDKWSGNKLPQACEWLGVATGTSHRATDDAVATGLVLMALRDKIPNVTMTEMLRRQQHYHELQMIQMKAWFVKKGLPWTD